VKKGFSLLELILVLSIFTFLFAAVLTILATQDRSWRVGYAKLTEQQEARRVVDRVARLLMQSKPEWVAISDDANFPGNQTVLFYETIFNEATQELEPGGWIGVRLNPNNGQELRMREQGGDWVAIAQEVESINFFGGDCPQCSCFLSETACPACDCSACKNVTSSCPVVKIQIGTRKEKGFSLSTYVTLRNNNIVSDEIPEPPAEGEF
jgi:prepilin-type N-terminal cleavage/methylation domain-containing protein